MYTQTGALSPSCCRRSLGREERKHKESTTGDSGDPTAPAQHHGNEAQGLSTLLGSPAFLKEATKGCMEPHKGLSNQHTPRDSSYPTHGTRPKGDKQPLPHAAHCQYHLTNSSSSLGSPRSSLYLDLPLRAGTQDQLRTQTHSADSKQPRFSRP